LQLDRSHGQSLQDQLLNLGRLSSASDHSANRSISSNDEIKTNDDGMPMSDLIELLFSDCFVLIDETDPNPKRRKIEEVNEALVRLPLSLGYVWPMLIEVAMHRELLQMETCHNRSSHYTHRSVTHLGTRRWWQQVFFFAGVRGDVSYYAPCGRKLRSFQEIDRVTVLSIDYGCQTFALVFGEEKNHQFGPFAFYLQFKSSYRSFSRATRGF
jgi:hypothetical protein